MHKIVESPVTHHETFSMGLNNVSTCNANAGLQGRIGVKLTARWATV